MVKVIYINEFEETTDYEEGYYALCSVRTFSDMQHRMRPVYGPYKTEEEAQKLGEYAVTKNMACNACIPDSLLEDK